jgi:hypothetical protein
MVLGAVAVGGGWELRGGIVIRLADADPFWPVAQTKLTINATVCIN